MSRSRFPETFGPAEKLVVSSFAIDLELMLIAALGFSYAGVIVMAVASAALAPTGLVIVTATGLRSVGSGPVETSAPRVGSSGSLPQGQIMCRSSQPVCTAGAISSDTISEGLR